jgi:hypothetical protein
MNIYAIVAFDDYLNEVVLKRSKVELRMMKATTIAGASVAPPGEAMTRQGLACRAEPAAAKAEMKTERTVRTVKSVLAHFPFATCCRPVCSYRKYKRASYGLYVIFYGWVYGGEGVKDAPNPNPNLNPNPSPSQSVAVSRSDFWERRRNGWRAVIRRTPSSRKLSGPQRGGGMMNLLES